MKSSENTKNVKCLKSLFSNSFNFLFYLGCVSGLGTRLKRKRMCRHILFFLLMQRYCSHPQLSIIHSPLGRQAIQLCTNTVELMAVRIVMMI
jgi:hypothetical protein